MTTFHELPPGNSHTPEEIAGLYNDLINTYGISSQHTELGDNPFPPETPPRVLGYLASLKNFAFGGRRGQPNEYVYTVEERTVDMPMLPPLYGSGQRHASLCARRRTDTGTENLGFDITTEFSYPQVRRLNIPMEAYQVSELSEQWFEYLSAVMRYRQGEQYEQHGYGPFIEQHGELLRAMEETMGFSREDTREADPTFRRVQRERSESLITDLLSDSPYSQGTELSQDWHDPDYDYRSRQTVLKAVDGRVPTLHISHTQRWPSGGHPSSGKTQFTAFLASDGLLQLVGTSRPDMLPEFLWNEDFSPSLRRDIPNAAVLVRAVGLLTPIADEVDTTIAGRLREWADRLSSSGEPPTGYRAQEGWNEVLALYNKLREAGKVHERTQDPEGPVYPPGTGWPLT